MNSYSRLKVLLLGLEFPRWEQARRSSYAGQLAFERALQFHEVDCTTITTPWFSQARQLCRGRRFDQVWVEIGRHDILEPDWLEWMSGLAPVRLGMLTESLDYSPEDMWVFPELGIRRDVVRGRLKYVTHVLACDEQDSAALNSNRIPSMWWPQAVPERFVNPDRLPAPPLAKALFAGAVYPPRDHWLRSNQLKDRLQLLEGPLERPNHSLWFDILHVAVRLFLRKRRADDNLVRGMYCGVMERLRDELAEPALQGYLKGLRWIREDAFEAWLTALANGIAVVNLPHFVKTYSGRVVEGMASGRPVISWKIPGRPRNLALFEDQREILLYDGGSPDSLASQIDWVNSHPDESGRMVVNARRKVQAHHTVEVRTGQILNWLESRMEPRFG